MDLGSAYIGKLERGEHRWPVAHVRAGLRGVFGVDDDASIGLYVIYGLGRSVEAVTTVAPPVREAEPAPTPSASSNDDADGVPTTVRLDVAAGAAVVITVDGERAGPIRVLVTTVPDGSPGLSALPLTSADGARVYSLADGRRRV
ncbi:hypothetical protein [Micromonospora rosaria]|uniref:hypothetical protein n=1 Tax=Micromonospora rosaria TaxID=47874 RepID=UPI0012FCB109|nr:hypothetical protein [Micromonospora rosaria]